MNTHAPHRSAGMTGAMLLAEQMHARLVGAQKASVLLRLAGGGLPDPEVLFDACESSGLGGAVLLGLGEDLVVLATGPRTRAAIELAACQFERAVARLSAAPIGVGLAHNVRPYGFDPQLELWTLLEVAREGAAVAESGGGSRLCHTELYELFGSTRCTSQPPVLRALRPPLAAPVPEPERLAVPEQEPDAMPRAPRSSAAGESQLMRRLHKLRTELERARARIEELEHLATVDSGVESVHREVQGLDGAATDHEHRRGLMTAIFRANLELRNGPAGDLHERNFTRAKEGAHVGQG